MRTRLGRTTPDTARLCFHITPWQATCAPVAAAPMPAQVRNAVALTFANQRYSGAAWQFIRHRDSSEDDDDDDEEGRP
jgi:hypothetical protein